MVKVFFRSRVWIVLLALIVLIGLAVLASGLNGLKYDSLILRSDDGIDFTWTINSKEITRSKSLFYLLLVTTTLAFIAFIIQMSYPGSVRPMIRKGMFMSLLRLVFLPLVAMIILAYPLLLKDTFMPELESVLSDPAFSPAKVGAIWGFWIAAAVMVVASALGVFLLNRGMDKWSRQKELVSIAKIAHSTLKELSSEKPPKNVIVRCYARMTATVNKKRGLSREQSMTPSEFAAYLSRVGLPREDVEGLTRIFERVRYGGQSVDAGEVKEAKKYLSGILKACEANA
jgi:hypothetical protein